MMMQNKIDRAMNLLKERNEMKKKNNSDAGWEGLEDDGVELGKNDILALVVSAFLVFSPILIVLIVIMIILVKI